VFAGKGGNASGRGRRITRIVALAFAIALMATQAWAHVERASYWPDPGPDRSVRPATGGAVPSARSLFTALRQKPPGSTRGRARARPPPRRPPRARDGARD